MARVPFAANVVSKANLAGGGGIDPRSARFVVKDGRLCFDFDIVGGEGRDMAVGRDRPVGGPLEDEYGGSVSIFDRDASAGSSQGTQNNDRSFPHVRTSEGAANAAGTLTQQQIRELMARDITPEDYELLQQLDEGVPAPADDRSVPSSMPSSQPPKPSASQKSTKPPKEKGDEMCTICLTECGTDANQRFELSICGHVFHRDCMATWISEGEGKTRLRKCPVCRCRLHDREICALDPRRAATGFYPEK